MAVMPYKKLAYNGETCKR